jgi:phosphopantothenoylcysteine decarboxylase/phosphopantothenate--cysteine ligase
MALSKVGVKTILITGPSKINFSKDIKVEKITSAEEMLKRVKEALPVDIAICAAAVSDFRPAIKKNNKLKRHLANSAILKLEKSPDILEYISKNNKNRPKIVVGFSAETENLIENSLSKIKKKYCDFIIANDVSKKNSGFNVDYNQVSIIDKKGQINKISRNKKSFIAQKVVKKILDELLIDDKNIN